MMKFELLGAAPLYADRLINNRNKLLKKDNPGYNENKRVIYITGRRPSGIGKTKRARLSTGWCTTWAGCSLHQEVNLFLFLLLEQEG
jgi:hypothetical protein